MEGDANACSAYRVCVRMFLKVNLNQLLHIKVELLLFEDCV